MKNKIIKVHFLVTLLLFSISIVITYESFGLIKKDNYYVLLHRTEIKSLDDKNCGYLEKGVIVRKKAKSLFTEKQDYYLLDLKVVGDDNFLKVGIRYSEESN